MDLGRLEVLVRQLQGMLGGNRVARGAVTALGAVAAGTGFTAARTGVGLYTVTFDVAFAQVPSLVAMVRGNAGALAVKQQAASTPTTTQWFLETFTTTTGALTDAGFEFVAVG